MKSPSFDINIKENTLVCGDNLEWMLSVPDDSVDLCYIDPPFFSNRNYEIVWGNSYETRSFGDRFAGGISHYTEWMEERIKIIYKKLKPTGSFYLHCDWHASHYLKIVCDKIFGYNNFRNEIVWCYTGPSNTKRYFPRKHDVIFYYVKDNKLPYTFNIKDVKVFYKKLNTGKTKGIFKKDKKLDNEGKIVEDYWIEDRDGMTPVGRIKTERIGYVTQKPEALIERIIKASSNEGDLILDCFAGGGTTAKVCSDLKRRFICGDVSPVAIRVIASRLNKYCHSVGYKIIGLPKTEKELKKMNGHSFADLVCRCKGWDSNPKKTSDEGIDGWANNKKIPIQIKNHSNAVGRPDLQKFMGAMHGFSEGIFVAWKFSKGAVEYVANVKKDENKKIKLVECKEIFEDLLITENKDKKLAMYFHQVTKVGQLKVKI